ncbi:hypothetical protein [Marinomonas flavescens]|uniref:hypothetical protein n=1 Tax=Marinomonas flavescens TaxID=2529379 RepID=UPI001056D73B|nr:hypothetical protein [Marinomonas flavescens]
MWTLSFLRSKSYPPLSRTLFLLLLILQAGCWYPLLQTLYRESHDDQRQQVRFEKQRLDRMRQSEKLAQARFLQHDGIAARIVKAKEGQITQWAIRGEALLTQWQVLQEVIQENAALGLTTVVWSAKMNGRWHGDLVFDVLAPKPQRAYQDWLPVRLQAISKLPHHWELVSTMTFEGEASALLSHKSSKRWVSKGAWLPMLGMTVEQVLLESVTLVSMSGDTFALNLRHQNRVKE